MAIVSLLSKQRLKPGGLEMSVVGECLSDSKPTHDGEGNVVDDSRLGCLACIVGIPRDPSILIGWHNHFIAQFEFLPQHRHMMSIRSSCRRVAALQQDEASGHETTPLGHDPDVRRLRRGVPLIGHIPNRHQAHRVQEGDVHGWCSL
jgi:hypothetical protein